MTKFSDLVSTGGHIENTIVPRGSVAPVEPAKSVQRHVALRAQKNAKPNLKMAANLNVNFPCIEVMNKEFLDNLPNFKYIQIQREICYSFKITNMGLLTPIGLARFWFVILFLFGKHGAGGEQ
jgi:hypothetical protein